MTGSRSQRGIDAVVSTLVGAMREKAGPEQNSLLAATIAQLSSSENPDARRSAQTAVNYLTGLAILDYLPELKTTAARSIAREIAFYLLLDPSRMSFGDYLRVKGSGSGGSIFNSTLEFLERHYR